MVGGADINMSNNNSNQTSYADDSRGVKNQDSVKEEFSEAEESLIAKMFKLVGERWPLIAGRIPGRTAEEIEKYWKSRSSSATE